MPDRHGAMPLYSSPFLALMGDFDEAVKQIEVSENT
jgi:hypothetical protein